MGLATAMIVLAQVVMPVQAAYAYTAPEGVVDKVKICHATNSNTNPYVTNEPSVSAVDPTEGHANHTGPVWNPTLKAQQIDWGDIIPPFSYEDANGETAYFAGYNWNETGMAFYQNDCNLPTAVAPTAVATVVACVPQSGLADKVSVSVTNTDDATNATVTYSVVLGGQTKSITLVDGANGNVEFGGLAAGTYSAVVTGTDGTVTTNSVVVAVCTVTPPTPLAPTAVASVEACTPESGLADKVNVSVTNTNDATDATVTYSVVLGGQTKSITLADGATGSVVFDGLSAGTYSAVVTGTDGTVTTNSVVVAVCTKTPRVPTVCVLTNNTYTAPWMYNGKTYPFAGAFPTTGTPAVAEFTDDGLYLSTPANESYTLGRLDAGNTPIADIDKMSYKVMRDSSSTPYVGGFNQTLPAYIIYVDLDGNLANTTDQKHFFYEPYYNGVVTEDTWLTPSLTGSAKWYVSGTGQALKTWDQLVAMYPNAVAIYYGFNQGTSNPGTNAYIAYMEFDCATTAFTAGRGEVEEPPTPVTPTTPVVPVVPGKGSVTPPTVTELPETGAGTNALLIGLLASAAAYGAVYFAQPKRRYE